MKKILPFVIILIVGIVIGWLCRQSLIRPETIIQRDTVVRVDTIRELYPVSIKEEVVDTIHVVARDTIRINDTLYVSLPMEKRTYRRDEYYAEVTGYNPRLTHIEVYPKTVYVNESVCQSIKSCNTLSFGIEANYLNTLSIPIYLEYGRMLQENVELYGQLSYDLRIKSWGAGLGIKAQLDW